MAPQSRPQHNNKKPRGRSCTLSCKDKSSDAIMDSSDLMPDGICCWRISHMSVRTCGTTPRKFHLSARGFLPDWVRLLGPAISNIRRLVVCANHIGTAS
jgi:hypothetical protein